MKMTKILFTAVLLIWGLILRAQIIYVPMDSGTLKISTETLREEVRKAKKNISSQSSEATKSQPSCSDVEQMIDEFKLKEEPKINYHLAFDIGDISFFCEQKMSSKRYRSEFSARRIILDEADRQKIVIKDKGTLSWAVGKIMAKMLEAELELNK